MTPTRAKALEQIIQRLWDDIHMVCEGLDETYVKLLDKVVTASLPPQEAADPSELRTVITHLKDARAAIERAKGAIT